MWCDLKSHPSRSVLFSPHVHFQSRRIPKMGISASLFVVGDCFSASGCDIVFMVVEIGAALAGRVFRLGGIECRWNPKAQGEFPEVSRDVISYSGSFDCACRLASLIDMLRSR
jgi:hypothetical protein